MLKYFEFCSLVCIHKFYLCKKSEMLQEEPSGVGHGGYFIYDSYLILTNCTDFD